MSIALDTNILFDILLPDPQFKDSSLSLLKKYAKTDKLIICDIVYGELALHFKEHGELNKFIADTSIKLVSMSTESLWVASLAWKKYLNRRNDILQCSFCGKQMEVKCNNCGNVISGRQHILSDFLIGGHALIESGKLLTRDRGFYRTYFKELKVIY
jgi:hypothetical protein